jgi:hypothetical protein
MQVIPEIKKIAKCLQENNVNACNSNVTYVINKQQQNITVTNGESVLAFTCAKKIHVYLTKECSCLVHILFYEASYLELSNSLHAYSVTL